MNIFQYTVRLWHPHTNERRSLWVIASSPSNAITRAESKLIGFIGQQASR